LPDYKTTFVAGWGGGVGKRSAGNERRKCAHTVRSMEGGPTRSKGRRKEEDTRKGSVARGIALRLHPKKGGWSESGRKREEDEKERKVF